MTDTLIAAPAAVSPATAQPQAEATPMSWKRRLARFGVLGVVVAALGVAAAVLPLAEVSHAILSLGQAAPVAIAVLGGLLLSVMVPRAMITMACGWLLGAALGSVTALAAAMIAAAATYYAGRWAGRGVLHARAGDRMARLDGWINRRGLSAVLLVRFLPLAPFGLIGYAYGTTSVCRKRYLLGTALSCIPSAVSYAVIGSAAAHPGGLNPLTLIPAALGFLVSTVIVWRWKRVANRQPATA